MIKSDPFKHGDVIRWQNAGCTYVAVKIGKNSFYTTSTGASSHIKEVATFSEVMHAFLDRKTTTIEVASRWERVSYE